MSVVTLLCDEKQDAGITNMESMPSVFDNPNLDLNPDLTNFLTICANRLGRNLTRKECDFISHAHRINTLGGRPYSWRDFKPLMSSGSFRQHTHNLRNIIDRVANTNPKYYKLRGLYTDEKLTDKYTYLHQDQTLYQSLDVLLCQIKHERPYIHDIRMFAKVSGLYENLILAGLIPNQQNKMITVPIECNSSFDSKVNVSKDSMLIMIGCTYNPIEYSTAGIITLVGFLGEAVRELKFLARTEFSYEPMSSWTFKYFHLNRDSIEHHFPPGYTLNTILGHTCIYKHDLPNGRSKIRLEGKLEPNTSIEQEIRSPRFQRATDLWMR